ncbi:class I SAM-dependent methyltransferase [Methanogenium organophilum]|uniref:Methyltransferase domain-containing protein n=1 Tax=Methanogenium organophilum TaxID=2199 RepID=A0A9X9S1Z0_METOG|nr:methyltransferase domain-containing protein [Methanogenium organophilum]WAI00347.1 methyltransferase domain-containing protein [Methanogenium organophilum]
MSFLTILFIIVLTLLLWVLVVARIIRRFWHFPAPAWIGGLLDSDYRRHIQPPSFVIERSGIRPSMQVLDLGCGSGAFTTDIARMVGPEGRVVAFDIQENMLRQLQRKLARQKHADIPPITIIRGDATALPFCDGTFDAVCMVTVLQEIPENHRALAEVFRVLRPGGVLGVTELFIDPDYPLSSTTRLLGEAAGFVAEETAGGLWNYTVRFRRP